MPAREAAAVDRADPECLAAVVRGPARQMQVDRGDEIGGCTARVQRLRFRRGAEGVDQRPYLRIAVVRAVQGLDVGRRAGLGQHAREVGQAARIGGTAEIGDVQLLDRFFVAGIGVHGGGGGEQLRMRGGRRVLVGAATGRQQEQDGRAGEQAERFFRRHENTFWNRMRKSITIVICVRKLICRRRDGCARCGARRRTDGAAFPATLGTRREDHDDARD
jgi:hypothetical protein